MWCLEIRLRSSCLTTSAFNVPDISPTWWGFSFPPTHPATTLLPHGWNCVYLGFLLCLRLLSVFCSSDNLSLTWWISKALSFYLWKTICFLLQFFSCTRHCPLPAGTPTTMFSHSLYHSWLLLIYFSEEKALNYIATSNFIFILKIISHFKS